MLTVKAQMPQLPGIYIKELDDFINVIHDYSVEVIFTNKKKGSIPTTPNREYFFFPKEGVVIHAPTNNYENIQDYINSKNLKFLNALEYVKYMKSGAKSRQEYDKLVINSFDTIEEKKEYDNLDLDKLYKKIPESLKELPIHEDILNILIKIKSPKDLLVLSKKYGSLSAKSFESFLFSGFSNFELWEYGKDNGFKNEEELIRAKNSGFSNFNDYSLARTAGIKNISIFKKYKEDIEKSKILNYACFELFLLEDINIFPNRFSKLLKTIKDISSKKYGESYIFTDNFKKIEDYYGLIIQLKKEPIYNILRLSITSGLTKQQSTNILTKVAIDASNVCWYEKNKNNNSKLLSSDLLDLERIVKEYGAKEIIFIADENLKFEVDDKNILNQLENEKRLIYSHKEPADKQLLSLSLNRRYVIISNDQYRDWTEFTDDSIKRIGFIKDSKYGFDLE